MSLMAIDRRSLLLGTLAFVGSAGRGYATGLQSHAADAVAFVSAAKRADGRHSILLLTADGRVLREVELSARGHDIAIHKASGRAVAFARRPGTFAVAFELQREAPPTVFTAHEGRHFYGHGVFSTDGRLLYVSENDIEGVRGVIGIYDVGAGYKKIGEHPSHGLGPHEIILLSDGRTLAVANGGLDTVPEAGRANLNTEDMRPSLTFVDAQSGALIADHPLHGALSQLSVRHIAADANGMVWVGGQWEGASTETPSLVGSAGRDRALSFLNADAPGLVGGDLKGYVGSMAVSLDGAIIAASAPKAGQVLYVDALRCQVIGSSRLKDVCGIAGEVSENFAASSGFGVLRHETPGVKVLSEVAISDIAFDNHLRRVG